MDFLASLNPQQLEAVKTLEGPLLVLAGAGSGKTRVITCRIAYLIQKGVARPDQILAVTFTNKAAEEMRSRIAAMLGAAPRTSSPLISTFHSLCVRILRRDIDRLESGYGRNFTIYDEDDQSRLVRAIMKDLSIDEKRIAIRQAMSAISWAKNHRTPAENYFQRTSRYDDRKELIGRIYKLYEQRLHQANACDFDDLLIKGVELLRRSAEVRDYYRSRFQHLMVDEFQDTNAIQYDLARLIAAGPQTERVDWSGRSLCVVGDIDQSIYAFRGSDFNIILGFQKVFDGTRLIRLEQNYRSTQRILDAANSVIENNQQRLPKNLVATEHLGKGDTIKLYGSYDAEDEAAFVARKIEEHVYHGGERCAVLYRTNSQSRLFEEALRRRGVSYNIVGGFSFYGRAEVKDIIAYLKLALNPHDDVALTRIINTPPRGIGKTTLDALAGRQRDLGASMWDTIAVAMEQHLLSPRAAAAVAAFKELVGSFVQAAASLIVAEGFRQYTIAELVKDVAEQSGYTRALKEENSEEAESRLQNIEELVNAAAEADRNLESLRDFIDHAALASDTDQYRGDAQVTLLTMHSAKGLEFPAVFIAGMEEGLFPHSRSTNGLEDVEEERRLCYVAITRAQKHLYLTRAFRRRIYGEETESSPSRFLQEIPRHLVEDLGTGGQFRSGTASSYRDQSSRAGGAGELPSPRKRPSSFQGKTYNSAAGVYEFLQRRAGGGDDVPDDSRQQGSFRVGSRVKHQQYGYGVVLRFEGSGDDAKLTVKFPGYGEKKFVVKYAALETV